MYKSASSLHDSKSWRSKLACEWLVAINKAKGEAVKQLNGSESFITWKEVNHSLPFTALWRISSHGVNWLTCTLVYKCKTLILLILDHAVLLHCSYDKAAFCLEELLLSNPNNYIYHQRYAEVRNILCCCCVVLTLAAPMSARFATPKAVLIVWSLHANTLLLP